MGWDGRETGEEKKQRLCNTMENSKSCEDTRESNAIGTGKLLSAAIVISQLGNRVKFCT